MEVSVLNLGSPFDWRDAVKDILQPITGEAIAQALGLPEAAPLVSARLESLKWVVLVTDQFMESQTEANEWGEGKGYKDRWHTLPFGSRIGGCGESPLYMKPRSAAGGSVIESLGIYAADARAFAAEAFVRPSSLRHTVDGKTTLDSILPEEIANEPALFICPERIWRLPHEVVKWLKEGEPRPSATYSELFLRTSLIHSLAHHVLPGSSDQASLPQVQEALAEHLCHLLLRPEERPWLFAQAWLLKPSPYLTYFVPALMETIGGGKDAGSIMRCLSAKSLGLKNVKLPQNALTNAMGEAGSCSKLMISPQMYMSVESLANALDDDPMLERLKGITTCALGPFDEYSMPWRSIEALGRLLTSYEPTLQIAAADAVDAFRAEGGAVPQEISDLLAKWCDANLLSETRNLAVRAWSCAEVDRPEGLADRYLRAAKSRYREIATTVPQRVRLNLPSEARRLLTDMCQQAAYSELQSAASVELAAVCASERDHQAVENLLLGLDVATFSLAWDRLEECGYVFQPWALFRLLAEDCPKLAAKQYWEAQMEREQAARQAIRERMMARMQETIGNLQDIGDPGKVDFLAITKALASREDITPVAVALLMRSRTEDLPAYLTTLLEHGGAIGHNIAAQIIESKGVQDSEVLCSAAGTDALPAVQALLKQEFDLPSKAAAFAAAAKTFKVMSAHAIAKSAEDAGEAWLVEQYSNVRNLVDEETHAGMFLGYLAYLSIASGWYANISPALKSGASLTIREKSSGNGLLHITAYMGDLPTAELLLSSGIPVYGKNNLGQTPLAVAAQQGHATIVRVLLSRGAVTDTSDETGRTPLSRAAECGNVEAVKLLLQAGASARILDKNRKTAAQYAAERGHADLARLLKSAESQAARQAA